MNTHKRKKSKIPRFKSYEEEAEFWDTHDTTKFEDEFKPVKLQFARPLVHILGVRLDAKTIDQLTSLGQKIGVGPSTLVRMWIMEKLSLSLKQQKTPEARSSQAILHQLKSAKLQKQRKL